MPVSHEWWLHVEPLPISELKPFASEARWSPSFYLQVTQHQCVSCGAEARSQTWGLV